MNIGFDAKRIFHNHSGLGNYGRNILSYLQENNPENQYFLFTPNKKNPIKIDLTSNTKIIKPQKFTSSINNSIWRTKGVLKNIKFKDLDVYHGLSNELPIGISKTNVKSIITVHDLIFVRFPELYRFIDRKIYFWKMKRACNEADKIIAISQQTKNDIVKFLDINPNKIEIVYQGCSEIYYQQHTEEFKKSIKKKYNLPEKFILNVGTIEPRKNAFQIVKALKKANIDFPLVIIGRETDYSKKIRKFITLNKMEKQVFIVNNVIFEDLPAIYQSAKIFIYPSFFEGFGIPIIEAFNSKTPVITSNIDVFKEVADDSALCIEKNNIEKLAEAILLLLENKEKRDKLVELGKKRALDFRGEIIAKELMTVYNKTYE